MVMWKGFASVIGMAALCLAFIGYTDHLENKEFAMLVGAIAKASAQNDCKLSARVTTAALGWTPNTIEVQVQKSGQSLSASMNRWHPPGRVEGENVYQSSAARPFAAKGFVTITNVELELQKNETGSSVLRGITLTECEKFPEGKGTQRDLSACGSKVIRVDCRFP